MAGSSAGSAGSTAAGGVGCACNGVSEAFKDAIIRGVQRALSRLREQANPYTCRMSAPSRASRGASPYLLLTLTPFFWACNWIIGRALHSDIPPMAMTFFRWLFAIVILAPFAWPHVRRDWPVIRAHWKTMLVLGAIGVGTHNGLAYLGLNYTTATNGVILNSFIPVMIITHLVDVPARAADAVAGCSACWFRSPAC